MRPAITLALFLTLSAANASAQQSLRTTALANGGVATNTIDYTEPVLTLTQLIERSDLIIHGRITGSRTVLFMDDRYVGTDYVVLPLQVMKQNPALNIAPRPGLPPSAAVVRRMGGTLVERASKFTTINSSFPESEAPRLGDEVVWFLRYEPTTEVFSFVGGQFGALKVDAGQVHPHTAQVAARRGDKPTDISAFLLEVRERIDGKRRDR